MKMQFPSLFAQWATIYHYSFDQEQSSIMEHKIIWTNSTYSCGDRLVHRGGSFPILSLSNWWISFFFLAPFPISFTKIILKHEKIDAWTYAYRNLSTDLRFVVVGTLPCHFLIMLKYAIIIILILRWRGLWIGFKGHFRKNKKKGKFDYQAPDFMSGKGRIGELK